MTLPIIDSMLRGDLRKRILATLKTEKEISLLWRDLIKAYTQSNQSLMALENSLIAAVETSGLVQVSAVYKNDRDQRLGAEQAREQGMNFGDNDYTIVNEKLCLDGVFEPMPEATPTDKFLHLLVKVECQRTIEALLMLVASAHDDGVVRTYIRKLFAYITSLCKDANDIYLKKELTLFYFELFHTFKSVLDKGNLQTYETDFENFIFEWKGEFPSNEVIARYNDKLNTFTQSIENVSDSTKSELPKHIQPEKVVQKDKFDLFLDVANKFTFEEMPKVKELGTPQKIRQLVECMLQEKESAADTFGHIAAWLDYLGFYKWIADNHMIGFKLNQYDDWCTKNIMKKTSGNAFRHYRLSVGVKETDTENASYRYLGWKYKKIVEEEYKMILEG